MRLRTRQRRTERLSERATREIVLGWGSLRRSALGVVALLAIVAPLALLVYPTRGVTESLVVAGVVLGLGGLVVTGFALMALQNPRIDRTRAAWLGALLVVPPLALLPYWWLHVWRAPRLDARDADAG